MTHSTFTHILAEARRDRIIILVISGKELIVDVNNLRLHDEFVEILRPEHDKIMFVPYEIIEWVER